ncbi:MAG: hypothetical protein WBQ44_13465 [Rhodococcus sp. (in: high G+C Gram-positive bacteria)]
MPETPDAAAVMRGASVALSSVLVTAAAHTAGGGMFPSETAALLLCLLCGVVGYAAAASPFAALARFRSILALAVAQGAGHMLLTVVDGHHHGAASSHQMFAAHALAVGLGAVAIAGAERGIHRAVTALRRVLPLLLVLVVDESRIAPPLPTYRLPRSSRLLDRSGSGNRGPPAQLA